MLTRTHILLLVVVAGLGAGCASTGAVPRPFPRADWDAPEPPAKPVPVTPAPEAPARAEAAPILPGGGPPLTISNGGTLDGGAVASAALAFQGIPYRLGGSDPSGFDCSGLVQYVFAQYGVPVPRVVEQQYEVGRKISGTEVQAGDLLFFSTKGRGATHVGIAIGGNRFVHAPNSTGVVRVEELTSGYWRPRYVGARRIALDDD